MRYSLSVLCDAAPAREPAKDACSVCRQFFRGIGRGITEPFAESALRLVSSEQATGESRVSASDILLLDTLGESAVSFS